MTPDSAVPDTEFQTPDRPTPAGACDTHMHIFGPANTFPYADGRDYTPTDALLPAYLAMRTAIGFERTVVVQPSIYGTDNACTMDAVRQMGGSGRAVVVLDANVSDAELERLHAGGARGVRVNLFNSGRSSDLIDQLGPRIAELDWHLQVFARGPQLPDLASQLSRAPVGIVVDHIGAMDAAAGVDNEAFKTLLRLVDTGRCWVKLSGAYRVDFGGAPWSAATPFAEALIDAAPDRLVWGTDWPHPHLGESPMPNDGQLLKALSGWAPDDAVYRKILSDNPAALYDFR